MKKVIEKMISEQEDLYRKDIKRFNSMAFYKFILGIFTISSLYNFISKEFQASYLFLALLGSFVFLYFFFLHSDIEAEMKQQMSIISLCKKHLDRISGEWTKFDDIGEEFIRHDHFYGSDLDIVGKKSLFQFLNTTHTWHGRQRFAFDLLESNYSTEDIIKRQQAIIELSEDIPFFVEIEHQMSQIGCEEAVKKLLDQLKDSTTFLDDKLKKQCILWFPYLTCVLLFVSYATSMKNLFLFSSFCIFTQFVLWKLESKKIEEYTGAVSHISYRLRYYIRICDMVESKNFTSEILNRIKTNLSSSDISTKKALNDLENIAIRLNCRSNPVLHLFLNIFFLWDFRCALSLEKWKKKYGSEAESWFISLGELESLFCFSLLKGLCGTTIMPVISSENERKNTVKAKKLGHPLILEESLVSNDVELDDSILVISGSNMSGKTTFMRSIGVNLVLAQCGSFVCAEKMEFTPVKIVTSMRIADDLSEGISTFYAEIKRIKSILDSAETERNTLFLIDEIFRGTNSVDRISGAETVISTLHDLEVSGLITTHDLELCALESRYKRMKNFHFSETYENKEIHFDYKIKSGKSTTTNAQFLMELVGIIKKS